MISPIPDIALSTRSERKVTAWHLPGAEAAFEGGRRALRAGFHTHAHDIFQALLPWEPGHPEVLVALSRTVMECGNPAFAEVLLEGLDSRWQRKPAIQVLRAECALRKGDTTKALSRAFTCAEWHPCDPNSRFLVARLQWLGGQESLAEVQFLGMAGDVDVGPRACAWAVFCGWRQGHFAEVSELLDNLRRDDVVCEALREFGHAALDQPWEPSDRVDPASRSASADAWNGLFHRRQACTRVSPSFSGGRILV